jgi:hypothetical protein
MVKENYSIYIITYDSGCFKTFALQSKTQNVVQSSKVTSLFVFSPVQKMHKIEIHRA